MFVRRHKNPDLSVQSGIHRVLNFYLYKKIFRLKKYLFILSILSLFTACKPTSSIITSKDVAIKKGIYKEPVLVKNSSVKNKKSQKEYANKHINQASSSNKVSLINDQNENE